MTIYYLYVKTHKTGLKYLGQTKQKDPHKYPGSGTRWINHLKKHGRDYTTEILAKCQSVDELREKGLYYSRLWNVVEDPQWANLKEEAGVEGGGGVKRFFTDEYRKKLSIAKKGKSLSPEHRAKLKEAWKNRLPCSAETGLKISLAKKGKKRSPQSAETKTKISEARLRFIAKSRAC